MRLRSFLTVELRSAVRRCVLGLNLTTDERACGAADCLWRRTGSVVSTIQEFGPEARNEPRGCLESGTHGSTIAGSWAFGSD